MTARRLASLSAILIASACGPSQDERMNVLLVTLDTTRADYLGAYGFPGDPTPSLDRLASEGTRFDLAIATASVTPVAHAAILTGRSNPQHGLRVLTALGGYRLPADVPTLATILDADGYRTHAIHSAFPVSSYFGFERGFQSFDDIDTGFEEAGDGEHTSWDVESFQRRSDETSDRAIEFLAGVEEPFFLWLHYWDPHDGKRKPPESTRDGGLSLYAEEVSYMDSQLGRVFDALASGGRYDDTLVVVVADHGQGLQDHDWRGHRILYQEQIRVPLLIRVPDHEQQPVVEDLVRTPDILPTVLDFLGLETPAGIFGESLRPLIEGRGGEARLAFADQVNLFDQNAQMVEERPKDAFLYCAMDQRWKLIYRPKDPELSELYDLESDPKESRNLYGERPEEVTRLLTALGHEAPWVTEPFAPYEDAGRDAALEALSALGYAAGSGEGGEVQLDWCWVCPDATHAERSAEAGRCAECDRPLVPRID